MKTYHVIYMHPKTSRWVAYGPVTCASAAEAVSIVASRLGAQATNISAHLERPL